MGGGVGLGAVAGGGRTTSTSASPTLQFAAAARVLAAEARRLGHDAPAFRSPPRVLGAQRTIRWTEGGTVVSVAVRGRPFAAVLADMVEGVVRANRLASPDSDHVRSAMWAALVGHGFVDTEQAPAPAVAAAHGATRYRPVA
jgi:hypothetical protein